MVNDEEVAGPICRLKPQAQLLLQSRSDRRTDRIGRVAAIAPESGRGFFERIFQMQIKRSRYPGPVDNGAVQSVHREGFGELIETHPIRVRRPVARSLSWENLIASAFRLPVRIRKPDLIWGAASFQCRAKFGSIPGRG